MPKISGALCQEPGKETKYSSYYTTSFDLKKKKKPQKPDKICETIVFETFGVRGKKRMVIPERQEAHEMHLTIVPLLPVESSQAQGREGEIR